MILNIALNKLTISKNVTYNKHSSIIIFNGGFIYEAENQSLHSNLVPAGNYYVLLFLLCSAAHYGICIVLLY